MHAIGAVLFLAAGIVPTKGWFAPSQPLNVSVKAEGDASLVLTDYNGRVLENKAPTDVTGEATINLRDLYVAVQTPGTYVLYLTKRGGGPEEFVGTPLVISVREDRRRGAPPGPMVVRVEPLRYAVMHTAHGPVTMAFYYDVAPNTVNTILSLAEQGYFDGLTFHRVVPGFVIQAGDPQTRDMSKREQWGRGAAAGSGKPVGVAEFSKTHLHTTGAVAMAHAGDAAQADSQFYVTLGPKPALNGKYAVFGHVISGADVPAKIEVGDVIKRMYVKTAPAK